MNVNEMKIISESWFDGLKFAMECETRGIVVNHGYAKELMTNVPKL